MMLLYVAACVQWVYTYYCVICIFVPLHFHIWACVRSYTQWTYTITHRIVCDNVISYTIRRSVYVFVTPSRERLVNRIT